MLLKQLDSSFLLIMSRSLQRSKELCHEQCELPPNWSETLGGGVIPGTLWWGRARQQKDFLKSVSSSHISPSFFLIYLEFKRQIGPSTPEIPQKPYPNSNQNRQRLYPFSDQIGPKTIPFGAAHTCKANIREYPLGEKHKNNRSKH